jgi:hypothetical protein
MPASRRRRYSGGWPSQSTSGPRQRDGGSRPGVRGSSSLPESTRTAAGACPVPARSAEVPRRLLLPLRVRSHRDHRTVSRPPRSVTAGPWRHSPRFLCHVQPAAVELPEGVLGVHCRQTPASRLAFQFSTGSCLIPEEATCSRPLPHDRIRVLETIPGSGRTPDSMRPRCMVRSVIRYSRSTCT